jgi:hypothetical protein
MRRRAVGNGAVGPQWGAMVATLLALLLPAASAAQDQESVAGILRLVADRVLHDASFQFEDARDGRRYFYPERAPLGAELRVASPSNDWRYWNGVLNIAMARVGEELAESTYAAFPARNVAFAFDHATYFQQKHTGENKWDYPFGQHFTMEELDDCGAMGASTGLTGSSGTGNISTAPPPTSRQNRPGSMTGRSSGHFRAGGHSGLTTCTWGSSSSRVWES